MNLINNTQTIVNILGLIIILVAFDIHFNYYYSEYIYEKIDKLLIYLGLKEEPKEEPFIGMVAATLSSVGMTVGMATTAVLFIALATKWVITLGIGIGEAIFGLLMTTIKGSFQIVLGLPEIGVFILYIIRWIIDHLFCFIKLIFKLPECIFFYAGNLIGQIFYLPFRALFFLIYLLGFKDIYTYVDRFWNRMEELDVFIFKYIVPIHIMHWPKNIRDKCFTCVRLKMDTISKKYQPVNKRFGTTIPRVVGNDVRTMGRGFKKIIQSFQKFP
tara:strand:- start:320 stop:1135 length:816 start_codon:yes stop_codon:yes gene_type:complete